MKKSRFTDEQIAYALKQQELGTSVDEVCRKMGTAQATFFNWKKKYSGLGPSELCRLKHRMEGLSLYQRRPKRSLAAQQRQVVSQSRPPMSAGQCAHRSLQWPTAPGVSESALVLLCMTAGARLKTGGGRITRADPMVRWTG